MDLVDLILLACLLTDPGICREHHVLLQSTASLRSCTMQAPAFLAQWSGAHPGWRVVRWHCDWPDHEGRSTDLSRRPAGATL
ncbi:conserved protein of unknown function [Rhodovastum atsumiense]|uniref:Uncharacterized protein n=1 Tax=Rhodovastum atsumiense TaxID=504468 RepID=A0A5M6IQH2_9PROT|nr:hypothetical protein [Rhodovastum atsumiense]KAA5610523.1 hypothetical protein F1189_18745 [Rhodovastum atsumiense]CAH2605033.1 conserved protein of unknown function [Rhodovastum atsumiense]